MEIVINAYQVLGFVYWTARGTASQTVEGPLGFLCMGHYETADAPTLMDELDYLVGQIGAELDDLRPIQSSS